MRTSLTIGRKTASAWRVPLFGEAGDDGSISSTIRTSPTRAVAWKQGSGVIRLIHGREGFCLLTGIGGGFHGGGEQVEIAIGVDDFWYLRGTSEQSGTFGEAIGLRFAGKPGD